MSEEGPKRLVIMSKRWKQYLSWEDQQLEKYINSQPGKKDEDDIIIAITWMKKLRFMGAALHNVIELLWRIFPF